MTQLKAVLWFASGFSSTWIVIYTRWRCFTIIISAKGIPAVKETQHCSAKNGLSRNPQAPMNTANSEVNTLPDNKHRFNL